MNIVGSFPTPRIEVGSGALKNCERSRCLRAPALTLVEALFTLLLGAILVTAVGMMVVHSARVRRCVALELESRWTDTRWRTRFRSDIESRLRGLPEGLPSIQFPDHEDEILEVLSLVGASDSLGPFPRRLPARVLYIRGHSTRRPGTLDLVRRMTPIIEGDTRFVEEVVVEGLRVLEVEEFREGHWDIPRSMGVKAVALPVGLRLRMLTESMGETEEVCTIWLSDLRDTEIARGADVQ